MNTIIEAKRHLRENFNTGTDCPCCGQFVKLYKRKLAATPSRMLIRLYSLLDGWNHVSEIVKGISSTGSNDFSKLAYWKLIEEKGNLNNDGKKNSGYWKITKKGRDFVENKIRIPSYVLIYNTKCYGFSDDETTIIGALGEKFSYNELMNI